MSHLVFQHEKAGELVVPINPDEVAWSYNLNTANYPTYGGEVVQILSVYIDDLMVKGTVRTYQKMESIYSYFARYMIFASQGSFDQSAMKMIYSHRNWVFDIQPLKIPGFQYSIETISPTWQMAAHVVDKSGDNYETLKDMIAHHALDTKDFKLKGIISPAAADPAQNPFSAPGTRKGEDFKPIDKKEIEADSKASSTFYNELLKSYLGGDYKSLQDNIGSQPAAFGKSESPGSSKEDEKEAGKKK